VSFEAQRYIPGQDRNATIGGTADSYLTTTTTTTIYLLLLIHLNAIPYHFDDIILLGKTQKGQSTWTLISVSYLVRGRRGTCQSDSVRHAHDESFTSSC
jgi:hypothetical protein